MEWKDWFYYDESSSTGLRWKVNKGQRARIGDAAGWDDSGYYRVMLNRSSYLVSRIIWELHDSVIQERYVIDHIDGNTANNSIGNLRCIPEEFNARNAKIRKDNKTGTQGICERVISGCHYVVAQWTDQGKSKGKYFNVSKLGYENALTLAIKAREAAIINLNNNGAGYTSRHGK